MLAYIGLEMAWNGHYGMSLDRCGLWDIVLHWLSLDILRQGTVGIAEQLFSTKARGSVDQYVIHSMHLWYCSGLFTMFIVIVQFVILLWRSFIYAENLGTI
jgi:hypothetical protein